MTSDEAVPGGALAGQAGSLPFDTSVAHQARGYDYLLGSDQTAHRGGWR